MSKYRITVDGKTYEMDVELIGANGASIQPVAKAVESKPVVSAPAAAPVQPAAPVQQAQVRLLPAPVRLVPVRLLQPQQVLPAAPVLRLHRT